MEHFKVLIIGAGASGVAAAVKLLENGFNNFRIIEAENRIGGRVNTTCIGSSKVELGAEWIHGETGNVVYELAAKYNMADTSAKYFFSQTKFFDFCGHQINKDISVALSTAFSEIMDVKENDLDNKLLNGSVGEYFDLKFQDAVYELRKKINLDESLVQKFSKVFENWENSIDASHSWYETSLSGHLQYWECPGNIITTWRNNCYSTLFDLLKKKVGDSEGLPLDDKIIFNKEVSKINWNKEAISNVPNVQVECSDGSVYSADHVLLTCSLGVLKERALQMFSPLLPPKKLRCIQNLGFGTVDKIFLKFSHRWWKNDFDGFAFLWSDDERKNDTTGWLNGVICFHPLNSESAILRGWITGEAAQQMETLSPQEITQGLNYLLDKFLGASFDVPSIDICLTSKWYTNPHFRGSYSCRLLKSEETNVWSSDLAEPVLNVEDVPVLLFGGEASSTHYFSTVHGAVEAGRREVTRLLPFLKEPSKLKKNYKVIIVGAGISGLSAAQTLHENGLNDLLVVEAQSKPGGRISTVKIDDYHLELGAQWIHGEKNDVFSICDRNNLLTEVYSSEGEGLYLRENGDIIDDRIIKEVANVVMDILESCEIYCDSARRSPHSIGQELMKKFTEYLESCPNDTDEVKEIKRDLLGWHMKFQLIDNSCDDLHNLSAKYWGLFKFCGGRDYVNFKNGYHTLIETLVKNLPEGSLLCDAVVERIDWLQDIDKRNSDSKYTAQVRCKNGLKFNAQHVIVTSSLGVLKSSHKSMFHPPLPNNHLQAIELLGFGVLNKIFLIYDEPWWHPGDKGFQLVWSQSTQGNDVEPNWGKYVTGFDVICQERPILLGWVGGEGAKIIENLTEEKIGLDATRYLKQFYRKLEIPLPKRVVRSSWWSNEYVRGGYSHITVECDELRIDGSNLALPLCTTVHSPEGNSKKPTILLAGESTHKNYYSTVHGAYESGQSQAQVILEYHTQGNK
ncbi:hypothetical protein RUM44_001020 [Polyplax serrata]|uniref:Amine oxidase n=1 Tax=Polyplax serrata TaxID=468196 RepID=A0ABR1B9A8_POLSC